MDTRYNINNNRYTETLNQKILEYNNLIRKAEITNRDNNGAVSKEEGQCYLKAAEKAAEIANMNIAQTALKAQWLYRKEDCEEKVKNIVSIIAPKPPVPPVVSGNTDDPENPGSKGSAEGPKDVTHAAPKGKVAVEGAPSGYSDNVTKEVTAEMIGSWWSDNNKTNLPTFADIAGLEDIKEELKGIIATIGLEESAKAIKSNPAKSYFFYGAPGTGKTFIINAFAGEMKKSGYNYLHLVGGDIHSSLVGVAEKIVGAAFREAIDNSPCVLFFDEFEELCKNRSGKAEGHEKRLTNAFLEAYNELTGSDAHVIVLAAANYPTQVDEAMMSRFTAKIKFPLPDYEARTNYFEMKRKDMNVDDSITNEKLVEITENYSYRDLDSVVGKVKDSLLLEAYKKYRVTDENGNDDIKKTDELIKQAFESDEFRITPESFYKTFAACPPTPNKNILEDIDMFEGRTFFID